MCRKQFVTKLDHSGRAVNTCHYVLAPAMAVTMEPDLFVACQGLDRNDPAVVGVQDARDTVLDARAVRLLSREVHERDTFLKP